GVRSLCIAPKMQPVAARNGPVCGSSGPLIRPLPSGRSSPRVRSAGLAALRRQIDKFSAFHFGQRKGSNVVQGVVEFFALTPAVIELAVILAEAVQNLSAVEPLFLDGSDEDAHSIVGIRGVSIGLFLEFCLIVFLEFLPL